VSTTGKSPEEVAAELSAAVARLAAAAAAGTDTTGDRAPEDGESTPDPVL
jgi:hypothetical protein